MWFRGLQSVARKAGIKTIYDLSAMPVLPRWVRLQRRRHLPWTVSDFSLMDAIESGIVKIPRTPVDDDATGNLVTYLRLWDYVGKYLPKKRVSATTGAAGWIPPKVLEGALQSLYRSYTRAYERWQAELAAYGEPPPVFIVVCPNTVVSSWSTTGSPAAGPPAPEDVEAGELPAVEQRGDGKPLARPVLSSSTPSAWSRGMRDPRTSARRQPARSRRSSSTCAPAPPARTSRRSATRTFCGR